MKLIKEQRESLRCRAQDLIDTRSINAEAITQAKAVIQLLAAVDRMEEVLKFYGDGNIDHEPDASFITNFGSSVKYKVSPYYGHVARAALKEES